MLFTPKKIKCALSQDTCCEKNQLERLDELTICFYKTLQQEQTMQKMMVNNVQSTPNGQTYLSNIEDIAAMLNNVQTFNNMTSVTIGSGERLAPSCLNQNSNQVANKHHLKYL